jgi:hypothetical protein
MVLAGILSGSPAQPCGLLLLLLLLLLHVHT